MQKVAKERLATFKPLATNADLPAESANVDFLHDILNRRENLLFKVLGKKLMAVGKAGLFHAWMLQESDLVQDAATAFGERLISDQFREVLDSCESSLKPVLTKLYHLYLLDIVEKKLASFITNGLISSETATQVVSTSRTVCRDLGPEALALCDAFAITDPMISAPIAQDWVNIM
ncbi:uncharacterized protein [Panulirus ornatus]|uniref:uncharacterized protein n=1 Tax=Panulirus ornatus TaxID=150431 RepID=UPI003A88E3F8